MILDIGAADAIRASTVRYLDIPPRAAAKKKSGKAALITLTAGRRRDLAARVTASIIRLGATYQVMIDFVRGLMRTTTRGRQLMIEYERNLGEAYRVAYADTRLLFDSAMGWLDIYPFVAGMVAVADVAEGGKVKRGPKLSARTYRKLAGLLRRYREASDDKGFGDLLANLEKELAGYEGLTSEEAVAKLRKSPAHG
jgi:hypothetical protein